MTKETPTTEDSKEKSLDILKENSEANACLSMGVGIGALSAGMGALTGIVCPLCFFIVPGLIGMGVIKKLKIKKP